MRRSASCRAPPSGVRFISMVRLHVMGKQMTLNLYWVSFRVEEVGNHTARRKALEEAISDCADGSWWKDPTSFVLFQSDLAINIIAGHLKAAINEDTDIVVIGMPNVKSARVIGNVVDDDLFSLWDWIKPA